ALGRAGPPAAAAAAEVRGRAVTAVAAIRARVRSLGDPDAARAAARYFKTGPGQYAEGDVFVGLRAATLRRLAREFRDLPPEQAIELLQSPVHEDRSLALLILADAATRGDAARKKQVCDLYLAHTRFVNNWDLVDDRKSTRLNSSHT